MPRLPIGDMGPCEVTWGYGESDAVIISPVLGRVALRHTDSIKDIQEEGFGDNAVDAVITGSQVEIDVPMTRSTLAQLEKVLHGVLISDILMVTAFVGCGMYDDARNLVIKPVCNNVASLDASEWMEILKTYPYRAFDLGYARDEQRIFLVKFKVFISQESGHVGDLYSIGMS